MGCQVVSQKPLFAIPYIISRAKKKLAKSCYFLVAKLAKDCYLKGVGSKGAAR